MANVVRAPLRRSPCPGALSVLVLYCLLPAGFSNRDLRVHLAPLLGLDPSTMTPGRMTYDLRRLAAARAD